MDLMNLTGMTQSVPKMTLIGNQSQTKTFSKQILLFKWN